MTFKELLKEKPYWLKGGIIGGLIALLYRLIPLIKELITFDEIPFVCAKAPCLNPTIGSIMKFHSFYIILYLIIGFFIGVLIGWIVEKIKSK